MIFSNKWEQKNRAIFGFPIRKISAMTTPQSFQNYLEQHDFSPLTVRGYILDLAHFSKWFQQNNGETLLPERLTPTDVRQYKQFLLTVERRKANTVNRHLAALAAYSRWALATGQIQADPTADVKSVKQMHHAPKWLDKNEQYALQRAIERDLQLSSLRYPRRWLTRRRDASLTLCLLKTGLRLSEVVALRLGDLQLSERKGSVNVQNGKGEKQRSVPLSSEGRKALMDWLAVRPHCASDFVWVAVEGEHEGLSCRAVQRVLARYAQEAGLEDLTPHICRHTYAKNLVNSGVGLEKVAALLGHSNLNTTRLYVTPDERELERAVESIG
jgi:integrase/recombinase XerC